MAAARPAGPAPTIMPIVVMTCHCPLPDSVLNMTGSGPDLATDFWNSPAKARSRGYVLLRSQCEVTFDK